MINSRIIKNNHKLNSNKEKLINFEKNKMKQTVLQKLKSKFQSKMSSNNGLKLDHSVEKPIWLKNDLTREEAVSYLIDKEIGVFVVRQS